MSLNAVASTQNRYCPPGHQRQDSSLIDDWLEISVLVRGVTTIVRSADASIADGVLQPLLNHRRVEDSSGGPEGDVESQVRQLVSPHVLSALDALAPAIDHRASSEADKKILHTALKFLKTTFAIAAVNHEHESHVMVWSILLDVEFFPMIKRREPMALILLAYSMVSLGTFRERWWVGGLSNTILRHIVELLKPLDGMNGEVRDEHVQERDYALTQAPFERSPNGVADLTAGQANWRDLLEWPLRESGIHDL